MPHDSEAIRTQMEYLAQNGANLDKIFHPEDTPSVMEGAAEVTPSQEEQLQALSDRMQEAGVKTPIQTVFIKQVTKVRESPKIGRNDPCPCGSGKKYKNCCLDSGRYEKLVDKK